MIFDSRKVIIINILSILLFATLFNFGIGNAVTKPLWRDEFSRTRGTIENVTYKGIFSGQIHKQSSSERNPSPLFPLLQKSIFDIFKYKFSKINVTQWEDHWSFMDIRSQIILRLIPIIFISLCIVFIFRFFAIEYSLLSGFGGLCIALSNELIWFHSVEAAGYSIWIFLTTLQTLLLLKIFRRADFSKNDFIKMIIINVFLSLTIFLSVFSNYWSGFDNLFKSKKRF